MKKKNSQIMENQSKEMHGHAWIQFSKPKQINDKTFLCSFLTDYLQSLRCSALCFYLCTFIYPTFNSIASCSPVSLQNQSKCWSCISQTCSKQQIMLICTWSLLCGIAITRLVSALRYSGHHKSKILHEKIKQIILLPSISSSYMRLWYLLNFHLVSV